MKALVGARGGGRPSGYCGGRHEKGGRQHPVTCAPRKAGLVPGRFRVNRAGSTASAQAVFYTVGGTATLAVTYVALPRTVTIAADILVKPLRTASRSFPR